MAVKDWLIERLGGISTKQLATFRTVGVQGLGSKLEADVVSLVSAYRNNPVVYSCVRQKADSITDPTVQVERRTESNEWEAIYEHPLTDLLYDPNPNLSGEQFLKAWVVSREVAGVFYCEVIRSAAGLPVQLYPLDPQNVFPVFETLANGRMKLVGYEWIEGAYRQPIPLDAIYAYSDWNLGGTLSPLAVALYNVSSDSKHTDYIRAFWENAGVPQGILKVKRAELEAPLTDQEITEMQDRWAAQYSNRYGRNFRIGVLEDFVDYQKTGMDLSELTSGELREVDEARVCMALGVPPLIVYAYTGLLRATYSNLDEAWAQFWKTTMSSQLKDLRTWLTKKVLTEFEPTAAVKARRIRVGWDLSEVGALQEDVTEIQNRALAIWEKGLNTLDEARQAVGLPGHPDPSYGALNYYEMQELAKALGGTAAIAALDAGLTKGGTGALDHRLGDLEYSIASMQGRIAALATGGDPNEAAVLLAAGSNGAGND